MLTFTNTDLINFPAKPGSNISKNILSGTVIERKIPKNRHMEQVIKPLLDILHEVYIGTENNESWVIDAKPGEGFSRAVKSLTAKEASTPGVPGGSTVAGHTGHLKWSLDFALQYYEGKQPKGDWAESWQKGTVDDAEWAQLQQELLESYSKIAAAIAAVKDWSNPYFVQGTLALLPHAAYHLGAIKQLIIAVKYTARV
jgi:hypothetical protein